MPVQHRPTLAGSTLRVPRALAATPLQDARATLTQALLRRAAARSCLESDRLDRSSDILFRMCGHDDPAQAKHIDPVQQHALAKRPQQALVLGLIEISWIALVGDEVVSVRAVRGSRPAIGRRKTLRRRPSSPWSARTGY